MERCVVKLEVIAEVAIRVEKLLVLVIVSAVVWLSNDKKDVEKRLI